MQCFRPSYLLAHSQICAKVNYKTVQGLHALLNMNKTRTCQLNKRENVCPSQGEVALLTFPASLSPICSSGWPCGPSKQ